MLAISFNQLCLESWIHAFVGLNHRWGLQTLEVLVPALDVDDCLCVPFFVSQVYFLVLVKILYEREVCNCLISHLIRKRLAMEEI